MTVNFFRRLALIMLVGILITLEHSAHADNVDRLVKQLSSSTQYKVRLSAALGLSKLGDARGIPALYRALKDPDKTVRGVAAAGLGKLVDASTSAKNRALVLKALKRVIKEDKNKFVRSQAQKAFDVLIVLEKSASPSGGAKIYVHVGPMASKASSELDAQALMKSEVEKTLGKHAKAMMTEMPGRAKPSKRELNRRGLSAFYIDGTLATLEVEKQGKLATVSCEVSMLIATYPEKSMFGFLKGGAKVQGGGSSRDIRSGESDCVAAVVEDLVRRKIIPAITTKANSK